MIVSTAVKMKNKMSGLLMEAGAVYDKKRPHATSGVSRPAGWHQLNLPKQGKDHQDSTCISGRMILRTSNRLKRLESGKEQNKGYRWRFGRLWEISVSH
jgi:hypothetical protein